MEESIAGVKASLIIAHADLNHKMMDAANAIMLRAKAISNISTTIIATHAVQPRALSDILEKKIPVTKTNTPNAIDLTTPSNIRPITIKPIIT